MNQTEKKWFFSSSTNGRTQAGTMINKVMQGDVLGPIVSSNMVDKIIGKVALETGRFYMYENFVPIPLLSMINETLGISV